MLVTFYSPGVPDIFELFPLWAELRDAGRALYDARFPPGYVRPYYRGNAARRDYGAIRRATTRYRRAWGAWNGWLLAAWPEYGRKIDEGWWAGPPQVDPCSSPAVVGFLWGLSGGETLSPDGCTGSRSGCSSPRAVYQDIPLGGYVVDLRDPHVSNAGHPCAAVDSADALRAYLTWALAGGGSLGVRTAPDVVTWYAGQRAGEREVFTPAPPYADEHQIPYPPACPR